MPSPSKKIPGQTRTVYMPDETLELIKQAAEKLGVPYTIFIRMAAKKEAERVVRRRAA